MEELQKKLDDILSKIDIDSKFLLKIILGLLVLNTLMFFYNIVSNNSLYNKVKEKVNEDKILVVDHNGNQYFKRIGYLTEDIIINFAHVSVRNLLEYGYDNRFNVEYANKYANEDIYYHIKRKYDVEKSQMDLDEGFYTLNIQRLNLLKADEINNIWDVEIRVDKKYNGLAVTRKPIPEKIKMKIVYKNNLNTNPLGLVISHFEEQVMTSDMLQEEEELNAEKEEAQQEKIDADIKKQLKAANSLEED